MRRGDIITAVFAGDYGKPRPNVVVQSDCLAGLNSDLLCPLTSAVDTFGPARILVLATEQNRLKRDSLIMADMVTALSLTRCRERLGALTPAELDALDEALVMVLGLAD